MPRKKNKPTHAAHAATKSKDKKLTAREIIQNNLTRAKEKLSPKNKNS